MDKTTLLEKLRRLNACQHMLDKIEASADTDSVEIYNHAYPENIMWLAARLDTFDNIYAVMKVLLKPAINDLIGQDCYAILFDETKTLDERVTDFKAFTSNIGSEAVWLELSKIYSIKHPLTFPHIMASHWAWLMLYKPMPEIKNYYPHDYLVASLPK